MLFGTMPEKDFRNLTDESLEHSGKALEHFQVANEMYQAMKDMQRSPERDEALMKVLAEDDEAIAEMNKSIELNKEFIDEMDIKHGK